MIRKSTMSSLRVSFALLPILALLSWMIEPAIPVRANVSTEPVARLQALVKYVHIYDDRDWGDGELKLTVLLREQIDGATPIASMTHSFSAGSGEDVVLERVVPGDGDAMSGGVSPEAGMPVYAGRRYFLGTTMTESDSASSDEHLGDVVWYLNEGTNWGIGTYTIRGQKRPSGHAADYDITFEIRPAPLPDLHPVGIKVDDLPNSTKKRVCTAVKNAGVGAAGPFDVVLNVDNTVPPGSGATGTGPAPGDHEEVCIETELPQTGEHRLRAVVDQRRVLLEFNETNNVLEQPYVATPPSPTPSPAQVDLTVAALRINGRVPDGKDDCKDGKNRVALVVKNVGAADAGSFAVRLHVDRLQVPVGEETVTGLAAGQEREIRFDGVRLKKGERELLAIVDAGTVVAESKEDNNRLKVTAACKDDD